MSTILRARQSMSLQNALVQPVVTPRFAVSTTYDLMTRLAELADKHNILVQVGWSTTSSLTTQA